MRVPYGTYRVGRTLRVGSRTRLLVHPHARLFLAGGAGVGPDSFLLANASPDRGDADDALARVECQGKRCGPIRDVVVHDLAADECHSFVRLLGVDSPIERIAVDRVRGGRTESALNTVGARARRPSSSPELVARTWHATRGTGGRGGRRRACRPRGGGRSRESA